jgi:uncharacterized membrane protein YfcA
VELIGYLLSFFVGISLGLIGGGGSILTVPLLVYFFRMEPVSATGYSLFIVGISSSIGSFAKAKQNLVDFKTAALFGIPSLITVFLTRRYLLPIIPSNFTLAGFNIEKSSAMLLVFSALMIISALSMILHRKDSDLENKGKSFIKLGLTGILVGLITGLLGAGGGFIIIPALVLFNKLPVKLAVGTSLFIISINSVLGITADFSKAQYEINWTLLLFLSLISIVGTMIGSLLCGKLDSHKLKLGFSWFVLLMGSTIMLYELL